ncbi:MAG: phosphoglycolate/pyridoxal phosphate family phosphatase [Candidatus Firestonebacteria bacterium]
MFFIFDLDGVLYRDESVIKGAPQTVCRLREQGHKVAFATNNAMLSRRDNLKKLNKMGFKCSLTEIMASSYAAGLYLSKKEAKGRSAFVIGEKGLKQELKDAGLRVFSVNGRVPKKTDYVVVGLDRKFSYKALETARALIERGAFFIATNKDYTYPGKNGLYPGGGSLVAAVEAASGVKAFLIGKPESFMLEILLKQEKIEPEEAVVVGDRYDTDVLFGKNAGAKTVMVLTGVTSKKEAEKYKGKDKPDYIIKSVCELKKLFKLHDRNSN